MQEIREELSKGYCAGITFSGGDPLYPRNRKKIKKNVENVTTARNFPCEGGAWVVTFGYLLSFAHTGYYTL